MYIRMTDPHIFYPDFDNFGIVFMIHKRTKCYIYCEMYNYEYEDNRFVFDEQIDIHQKRYKITNLNTECEGIRAGGKSFEFRNGLTLAQALGYHESNNDVDASV